MNLQEMMEKHKGGNGTYFSLKDDKDTATIRFLYDVSNIDNLQNEDLDVYLVHQVEIDGKKKYIQCPDTKDCPLCKSGNQAKLKAFLKLYDYTDNTVKIWERGPGLISTMLGLINKYGALYTRKYDVERHGKAKDPKTSYQFYALDKDDAKLSDFEIPEIIGKLVFIKSDEEMNAILKGETEEIKPRTSSAKSTDIF